MLQSAASKAAILTQQTQSSELIFSLKTKQKTTFWEQ